jgi:cytochrome P450
MAVQSVLELDLPAFDETSFNVGEGPERDAAVAALAASRSRHWLATTPLGFAVTRYEDVFAILRDRRFHNALALRHPLEDAQEGTPGGKSILIMEDQEHTRLRRLVAPAFSPKNAERYRPFMREVANSLLEPFLPTGRIEAVEELCDPYPIPLICELLGAPREDWKLFSHWSDVVFRRFNQDAAGDMDAVKQAFAELRVYVTELVAER